MKRVHQRIDALLLVGGFSGSEYLFKRVDVCDHLVIPLQITSLPHPPHIRLSIASGICYFHECCFPRVLTMELLPSRANYCLASPNCAGPTRLSNQSHCTALRCGYCNMSWRCAVRIGEETAGFQCHCSSVLHYEGAQFHHFFTFLRDLRCCLVHLERL